MEELNLNGANSGCLYITTESEKEWVCEKGHILKSDYPQQLVVNEGLNQIGAYTFCPICYLEWFKANIPTMVERGLMELRGHNA